MGEYPQNPGRTGRRRLTEWGLVLGLALTGAALLAVWRGAAGPRRAPAPQPMASVPEPAPARLPDGSVVSDCAAAATLTGPWRLRIDPSAATGTCLDLPDGAGKPPQVQAAASFTLDVPVAATYRGWVRVWWQDACGNSLTVVLDAAAGVVGQDAIYWRWHWVPWPGLVRLAAGSTRIVLQGREDGVRVDQFLLCPDPQFIPTGPLGAGATAVVEPYFADDFLRSPETPNPGWDWDSASFQVETELDPNGSSLQETLRADSTECRQALVGLSSWRQYRVEASLWLDRPGKVALLSHVSKSGAVLWRWSEGAGARAPEVCLIRRKGTRQSVLARAPLALRPRQWYRFALTVDGPRVTGLVDGNELASGSLTDVLAGKAGLEIEATRVHADDFLVCRAASDAQVRHLELQTFTTERVVRTVFDDFTEEEVNRMHTGPDADLLRREDQHYVMIGEDANQARFSPGLGRWRVAEEVLTVEPGQGVARLVRNRALVAELRLSFRLRLAHPRSAGGVLFEGDSTGTGNLVLVRPDQVELRPEVGAGATNGMAGLATGTWHEVQVCREQGGITVSIGGKTVAQFAGVKTGSGLHAGLVAEGGAVSFDEVEFSSLPGTATCFYPFDRPEPDWLGSDQSWELHTGITCKDASHWLTCRAGPAGAGVWSKSQFATGDLAVSVHVFEHSIWYGWQQEPTHEHAVYAGLGLLIASDGSGLGSGYAAVINPVGRGATGLFRNGQLVARADPRALPLTCVGGHVPVRPRGSYLVLRRRADVVQLLVNAAAVIEWRDPAPLTGGHVALFAGPGISNWADVSICASARTGPASFWPGPLPPLEITRLVAALQQ